MQTCLAFGSGNLIPFSCGGALDAPSACSGVRRRRFTSGDSHMQANTFDVIERRKRITFFKLGKLWVFKYFLEDKETFKALLDHYSQDTASSSNP